MIKIKDATESDILLIQHIVEKTWWPTYKNFLTTEQIQYMLDTIYSKESITNVMRNGSQKFIIIYENNIAGGFAAFGLRSEDPSIAKLHKLYVLIEHHGKGFGKLLMEEIKNRLLEKNIHTLDLNVNRYNPAQEFYKKLGFRIIKEEDIPIGPYWMNDYVMRLIF
jgi:ribosomal protein S18 acetylase RimI-like enzyme